MVLDERILKQERKKIQKKLLLSLHHEMKDKLISAVSGKFSKVTEKCSKSVSLMETVNLYNDFADAIISQLDKFREYADKLQVMYNKDLTEPGSDLESVLHELAITGRARLGTSNSTAKNGATGYQEDKNRNLSVPAREHPVEQVGQISDVDKNSYGKIFLKPGCPAKKLENLGPTGGDIELFGCHVRFPLKSLRKDGPVELSVDNDPKNFPKQGMAITPILSIEPSMTLDTPAIVTMRTSCRAAKGEIPVQVWTREKEKEWEKSQVVFLKNKTEIQFEVSHFSGEVATVAKRDESRLEHMFCNRVFMKKDTAEISSLFWQDEKCLQETMQTYKEMNYVRLRPTDFYLFGKLGSEFLVEVKCDLPEGVGYTKTANPEVFRITRQLVERKILRAIHFHLNKQVPNSVSRVGVHYSVTFPGNSKDFDPVKDFLPVDWPILIKEHSSASKIHIYATSKEITGTSANNGAIVQTINRNTETQYENA